MVMVVKSLVAAEDLFEHLFVDDFARRTLASDAAVFQT